MRKTFKWFLGVAGAISVLIVAAMVVLYLFFDATQFKHQIEEQIRAATGRPVTLGGEIELSLFPWVGVALSDMSVGNLAAFKEKEFVKVGSFEIRVKLLPLLKRDIEIERLVLKSPVLMLITNADGQTNWSGTGSVTAQKAMQKNGEMKDDGNIGFFRSLVQVESFKTGEVKLEDATVLWVDHVRKQYRTLSKLNLTLQNVSLGKPVDIDFDGLLDAYPLAGRGVVGPLGKGLDLKTLPMNMTFRLFDLADVRLEGKIDRLLDNLQYRFKLDIPSFSPRNLLSVLKIPKPSLPRNGDTFNQFLLNARIEGDLKRIDIQNGAIQLDQTRIGFSFGAKNDDIPEITFDIDFDHIDINRYLPDKTADKKPGKAVQPDFESLKKIVVRGLVRGKRLDYDKISAKNIELSLSGRKGQFSFQLKRIDLFGGKGKGRCLLDLGKKDPSVRSVFSFAAVRSESAAKAFVRRRTVEGPVNIRADLSTGGIEADKLLKRLNGTLSVDGRDLSLFGFDLDKILEEYADTQSFGFLDVGSFFVLGPFGPLLTRAYENIDAAATLGKGTGLVRQLNSDWQISNGYAAVKDVAFATKRNRIAAKGKINLVTRRFDNFIVALIDPEGCPKFSQTLNGPVDHPEIDKAGFVGKHIVAPLASLFKKTGSLFAQEKCQPFYQGKVPHPVK